MYEGLCFLYKQKTAYEMRIRDWSSDVCSSDLQAWTRPDRLRRIVRQRRVRACADNWHSSIPAGNTARQFGISTPVRHRGGSNPRPAPSDVHGDRKSVVQGKHVSLRVDLDGRRIIKQTRTKVLHNTSQI